MEAVYLLNDDVASSTDDTKTLSLDYTGATLTKQSLVGSNSDTKNTSIVTENNEHPEK
jgi:hypothetical protein